MVGKKFNEFAETTTLADSDIFLIQPSQGVNKKVKWSSIKTLLGNIFAKKADIANDLTTNSASKMLSASMGKLLRDESFCARGVYEGDVNQLKKPGGYWCTFANCQNAYYTTGYGFVEVIATSGSTYVQRIARFNNEGPFETAERFFVNNQWHDWCTFAGGNVSRTIAGSKVLTTTGGTSVRVFTNEDIDDLTGLPGAYYRNTAVFFSNGDGNANDAHIGSTYKDEAWYATFNKQVEDLIRVNYLITRW